MRLYENEFSSAASRVRIALALKGLNVERQPINIFGMEAESRQAAYLQVNPQGLVPALLTDEGTLITQSLAIIEYLDELHPEPPLLPRELVARAFSRSVALAIASEIHPLLPPRVGARLSTIPGIDANGIADWNRHWISEGMAALETLIAERRTGRFVVGDRPSVADVFLFPQTFGAERLGLDVNQWPNIAEIVSNLRAIPAFAGNAPSARK
ncbi:MULTISPECIES: maleylacetoacetate isomerase [unclassified Sinorhizobium]|uniref:maleylacetoacetate isomerase n=1 Tax=unclassified Sinorhizobium TaxID=2613772 RepID=UPI0035263F8D